jgi:hypothetical protein
MCNVALAENGHVFTEDSKTLLSSFNFLSFNAILLPDLTLTPPFLVFFFSSFFSIFSSLLFWMMFDDSKYTIFGHAR